MRKRVLIIIAAFFYYSGLVKLARWWLNRSGQKLVILNYHQATGGDLLSHLHYLYRHYRIVPLEAALEELYMPYKRAKRVGKQRVPLVLTFDDGYHDNYTHAFAFARHLQVPFTVFLIPGYIESGDYFWWQEGNRLVSRTQISEVNIEGHVYHLDQSEERNTLSQHIFTRLCQSTSIAEREAFLSTVRKAMDVPSSVAPEEKAMLPLQWTEVREMEESGLVTFGAHTMHHPILTYLTDTREIRSEIEQCRSALEDQLGHRVRAFAYPVGRRQHIGDNVISTVQQAGYDWAFTTMYGLNTPQTNPYLLRRIEADVTQHWLVVAAEAAGLWSFFSWLRWIPAIRKTLLRGVPV